VARILVVEDCPDQRALIERTLGREHELRMVPSVAESERACAAHRFDLVLVDIALPDGDGFAICERLQRDDATREIPVIFLTASEDLRNKVLAFRLGADDYVVKPCHAAELLARVDARLRRAAAADTSAVLAIGDLRIDLSRFAVERNDGGAIEMTPHELRLLHLLARRPERVVSRAQILESVWGDVVVSERTIDTHVCNLRRKLGASRISIRGVRGVGYRLHVAPDAAVEKS
jgi:two-component system phosphate regulon response regulator PhoB